VSTKKISSVLHHEQPVRELPFENHWFWRELFKEFELFLPLCSGGSAMRQTALQIIGWCSPPYTFVSTNRIFLSAFATRFLPHHQTDIYSVPTSPQCIVYSATLLKPLPSPQVNSRRNSSPHVLPRNCKLGFLCLWFRASYIYYYSKPRDAAVRN